MEKGEMTEFSNLSGRYSPKLLGRAVALSEVLTWIKASYYSRPGCLLCLNIPASSVQQGCSPRCRNSCSAAPCKRASLASPVWAGFQSREDHTGQPWRRRLRACDTCHCALVADALAMPKTRSMKDKQAWVARCRPHHVRTCTSSKATVPSPLSFLRDVKAAGIEVSILQTGGVVY